MRTPDDTLWGHVDTRQKTNEWAHGHMGTWAHGHMGTRTHGHMEYASDHVVRAHETMHADERFNQEWNEKQGNRGGCAHEKIDADERYNQE